MNKVLSVVVLLMGILYFTSDGLAVNIPHPPTSPRYFNPNPYPNYYLPPSNFGFPRPYYHFAPPKHKPFWYYDTPNPMRYYYVYGGPDIYGVYTF